MRLWLLSMGNLAGPTRGGFLRFAKPETSTGKTGTPGAGGVVGMHYQGDFFNDVSGAWAGPAVTVTRNANMWPFHVIWASHCIESKFLETATLEGAVSQEITL